MTCAGDSTFAAGVDAKNHARGEASLESAAEPAVELREQPGGGRIVVCQRAHGAHDQRYRHGRHEPLAADIAQNHKCRSAFQRDDLKEIAADFLSRTIGAGQREAGDDRQG